MDKEKKTLDENEKRKLRCPLGGDENNDCSGCGYSPDYHFVNGKCVERPNDEKTMSKKGNMAYWDSIEQLAENYIRQLIPYSSKPIDFGNDEDDDHATTIMEIGKEVTEFTYKLLESQYGVEFPYVEGNF